MTSDIENELLLRVAQAVCHEEQMTVWSGDFASALGANGYLRDLAYDEVVELHQTIQLELQWIIARAMQHPEASRVLREAAEGCAPKEEPKSYWGWWAGANEEWCTIGPCSSRDQVIAEATDEVLGEFQDGDTWKLGFHICEANKPPLRLADWIGADDLLGQAEVAICDSDRVSCEYDEGPWFHASAEQESDLERRVKAACDAWQAAHGLVFTCTSFSSSRNHEHVVVPHPLPEPPPPARIEDAEEPIHG